MVLLDTLFLVLRVQEGASGPTGARWDGKQGKPLHLDAIVLGVVKDAKSLGYVMDVLPLGFEGLESLVQIDVSLDSAWGRRPLGRRVLH